MCASVSVTSHLLPYSGKTISYIRNTIKTNDGLLKRAGIVYDIRKYAHIVLQFGTVDVLTLFEAEVLDMVPPTAMCNCLMNLCDTIRRISPQSIILISTRHEHYNGVRSI